MTEAAGEGLEGAAPGARVARIASAVAIVGALLVLIGWILRVRVFVQPLPSIASMKANAALGVIAVGIALWLLTAGSNGVAALLGWLVAIMGVLTISQDVFGFTLGIDQLLLKDWLPETRFPAGRMAPLTALSLVSLGAAVALVARRKVPRVVQALALLVALNSVAAVLGYAYGVSALYQVPPFTTMALHSAILLFVLSAGILSLDPTSGVMAVVSSDSFGGKMARRLLPAGVLVPVVAGWLRIMGEGAGLYGREFGFALVVVMTTVVLSVVIWLNARSLMHMDLERHEAETALRQVTGTLERRVSEQTRELARSEKTLRGLLEAAPDAMVVTDPEGIIVLVNAQTENLFGYDRDELLHQRVELLMPDRYREVHVEHRTGYVCNPTVRTMGIGLELRGRRKDGTEFPVEISVSPLHTAEGTLFSSAIRDITAATLARDQIRSSLAEKELLLKEIHHRVRNNLQVITSLLKLESDSVTDPRAVRAFRDSLGRVRSMAMLHETLYQSGDLGHVDLADYLRHLATTLAHNYGIEPECVTLSFAFDQVTLGMDYAVPCGLIANELITNAFKHAFPDRRRGEVSIALRKCPNDILLLRIADNGVGLPTALDVDHSESLGLQLVTLLVDQVHGTLRTTRTGGTCFEITFFNGAAVAA